MLAVLTIMFSLILLSSSCTYILPSVK